MSSGCARRAASSRLRLQAEPHELVVGRVGEHGLQRAARDRLPLLDQLQCALHATERQVEARLRAVAAARVQRDDAAADVDDRRARRAARGARGRLDVERVEVVVLADAVLGRLAIEPRERAGEDRELLARVVADDADLGADLRALRIQRQRRGLDVAELRRVVAVDAEVVDRVAVDRAQFDFLAVLEDRGRDHGPRRHDVPVGQDQAALGIDDEAGRLARLVPLGVERARLVDLDRDDRRGDALERAVPGRVLLDRPADAGRRRGLHRRRRLGLRERGVRSDGGRQHGGQPARHAATPQRARARSQVAAECRAEAGLEFVHVESVALRAGVGDLDRAHQ